MMNTAETLHGCRECAMINRWAVYSVIQVLSAFYPVVDSLPVGCAASVSGCEVMGLPGSVPVRIAHDHSIAQMWIVGERL